MTATHKISLLVPCFNASKYINNFIDHLVKADLKFDEVIFYNDGSTDDTLALLKSSGFKYLTSDTNSGPGYARNRLAAAATCDYIHFHDIDDRFNPDFISIINKYLSASPDIIVGNADWVDEQTGKTIIQWRYDADEANKDALAYFISHPLGIINTVYKKDSFFSAGGFNEKIKCWEDSDLHTKLAGRGYKFVFTGSVLAYSIRHNKGISNNQDWCWQCRLKFLEQYLAAYPSEYTNIILDQVAICALAFYNAGMIKELNKCADICKQHGVVLPSSKNWLINALKRLSVPPRIPYDVIAFYKKLS